MNRSSTCRMTTSFYTGSNPGLRSISRASSLRAPLRYWMFCPKCATELVRQDGELQCLPGEMALSHHLEHILMERYGNHVPAPDRGVVSIDARTWYCPGCGTLLDEQ